MILPPFVGAIGLQQILGRFGALNALFGLGPVDWLGQGRFFGVVLLQALGLYPIMYLNVAAALANVDPAMEEAAANLGSGTARTFWRITLPLIMPGLFAGGTIVFIWSFTELGTPLIMNFTRCTPVQVFDGLKEIGTNPFPFALVAVMLGVSVVLYTMSKWVFGGQGYAMQGKAALAATARPLRGGKAWLAALPMVTVAGLALLPHVGVILTSVSQPGSWYQSVLPSAFTGANFQEALGHSLTVGSIRNSLLYSVLAVTVNLGLGIMIAFVLVRSDLPGRGLPRRFGDVAVGGTGARFGVRLSGHQFPVEQPGLGEGKPLLAGVGGYSQQSDPVPRDRLRGPPTALHGPRRGGGPPANLGYPGRSGGQSRRLYLDNCPAHHAAPDFGEPDRRRLAQFLVQHAGSVRQPDAGPAAGFLPDHQDDL